MKEKWVMMEPEIWKIIKLEIVEIVKIRKNFGCFLLTPKKAFSETLHVMISICCM